MDTFPDRFSGNVQFPTRSDRESGFVPTIFSLPTSVPTACPSAGRQSKYPAIPSTAAAAAAWLCRGPRDGAATTGSPDQLDGARLPREQLSSGPSAGRRVQVRAAEAADGQGRAVRTHVDQSLRDWIRVTEWRGHFSKKFFACSPAASDGERGEKKVGKDQGFNRALATRKPTMPSAYAGRLVTRHAERSLKA